MYLFITPTHFTNVQVQLEDIVKLEDQDSDYESMSSDSSMKKDEKGGGGGLLAVDNSEINSHTWTPQANQTFTRTTIEALPTPDNYQVRPG